MDLKKISEFIRCQYDYLDYNYRLYDINNNNLTPYLKKRLRTDLTGEASYNEAESRLSVINLLPKIVSKLSKVYQTSTFETSYKNQELLNEFMEFVDFESVRQKTNELMNLSGIVALEPILEDSFEESFIRVLPAHTFLCYSDDIKNPERMTHFIKIISHPATNIYSKTLGCTAQFATVKYEVYTKDKYFECEGETIIQELDNPYKQIPFVVVKKGSYELMPSAPIDDYEMVTLLPLLLTDGNYALKFQAFSIIYALNTDIKNLNLSPNAVWFLQSNGQEGDKPEIGTIKPTLSIDEMIKNIYTQYSLWLESRNIKISSISSGQRVADASGISKIIDEADIYDDVSEQRKLLLEAEKKLFKLIEVKSYGALPFSQVVVNYEEHPKLPELPKEKLERLIMKYENKLMTYVDLVKETNNLQNIDDVLKYIEEIKKEQEDVSKLDETENINPETNELFLQGDAGEGAEETYNRADETGE